MPAMKQVRSLPLYAQLASQLGSWKPKRIFMSYGHPEPKSPWPDSLGAGVAVSRWFNFPFSGLGKANRLDGYEAPDKKVDAQQTGNDRLGCSAGECCVSAARLSKSACWKMSVHRELL